MFDLHLVPNFIKVIVHCNFETKPPQVFNSGSRSAISNNLFMGGTKFSWNEVLILILMSNVRYLTVILTFLVATWLILPVTKWLLIVTARYLVATGGYCLLLVVTACYRSLLLVPTFSMNKKSYIFGKLMKS